MPLTSNLSFPFSLSKMSNGKLVAYLTFITIILYLIHNLIFAHIMIQLTRAESKGKAYVMLWHDDSILNQLKMVIDNVPIEQVDIKSMNAPLHTIPNNTNPHIIELYHLMHGLKRNYIINLHTSSWQTDSNSIQTDVSVLFDHSVFYPFEIKSYATLHQNITKEYSDCLLPKYSVNCKMVVDNYSYQTMYYTVNKLPKLNELQAQ